MKPQERKEKLIALMDEYSLDAEQVGNILDRSAQTVRSWRCVNLDRCISQPQLRLLELELAAKAGK